MENSGRLLGANKLILKGTSKNRASIGSNSIEKPPQKALGNA